MKAIILIAAGLIGTFAARADEMKCGQCGASPEQIVATYGKPDKDVIAVCGEKAPDPYPCRKLTYNVGLVLTKETHGMSFAKLPAFGGRWGLVLCVRAVRGNNTPEIRKPCFREGG